jgi:hypothetical protein
MHLEPLPVPGSRTGGGGGGGNLRRFYEPLLLFAFGTPLSLILSAMQVGLWGGLDEMVGFLTPSAMWRE